MISSKKKEQKSSSNKGIWIVVGLLLLGIFAAVLVGFLSLVFMLGSGSSPSIGSGNVAVIDISGIIKAESSNSFSANGAASDKITKFIEKADENPSVSAVLFRINSGGGSPVATDEIASAIKSTNKTTVAVIRETGASGAYWIASACDEIFANRMSIVGSIGVTSSHLGFSEFIKEHNVTYRRLVSGKYKDIGTPLKEMTAEEKKLYKQRLDVLHEMFINAVAENRDMSKSEVEEVATGLFWTGYKAKKLNLIDRFGGEEEALNYIEDQLDIEAKKVKYQKEPTFTDILFGVMQEHAYHMGEGIGSALVKDSERNPYEILV